ncbi:hypothetical protein K7X08_030212 [Anisodus acutangulus]|uniref:NAC domain-containing protein n=1 Tax=Anisodus acutangulus TaxID=402998 RepID=A0A9Q1R363_9SOLA|nr:hypothetical protein K7X08_030212 [Anisodus acutangulus]
MEQEGLMLVATAAVTVAPPTSLAPGFRFHPTDEELVRYYLRRKACGKPFRFQAVTEIDVYKSEPWELAEHSSLKSRDMEWYFFSPVDKKYCNGSRLNRSLRIGMKKTLVFHSGRAPDGKRTNWVMHEYRLADEELEKAGIVQDSFVLCRIFQKSGLGPPTGDRYAPFVEEEWDDDSVVLPGGETEDDVVNGVEARAESNELGQDAPPKAACHSDNPVEPQSLPFVCKRERLEEPELSLSQSKRSKHDDPSSSRANGSEDSTITSQDPVNMMTTKDYPLALLGFPLLESFEPKESQPSNTLTFDSSNLEKSVPPGYLKFISNLENGILNVSMERETLKIEVMRAQAMINVLQSRIDLLTKENKDMRTLVRGG